MNESYFEKTIKEGITNDKWFKKTITIWVEIYRRT
jgi:hypothetical protein